MKPITLSEREAIIAVVPEYCAGPGWSNALIWVHICDYATNTLRSEAIRPRDQTPEQMALFATAAAAQQALRRTVPTKTTATRRAAGAADARAAKENHVSTNPSSNLNN